MTWRTRLGSRPPRQRSSDLIRHRSALARKVWQRRHARTESWDVRSRIDRAHAPDVQIVNGSDSPAVPARSPTGLAGVPYQDAIARDPRKRSTPSGKVESKKPVTESRPRRTGRSMRRPSSIPLATLAMW